jgi:hypothetical protein
VTDFDEFVERAKRTSFRAGIASLFVLVVIVSAVLYSALQLRSLESKKADVKGQIILLTNQLDELQQKFDVAHLAVSAVSKRRDTKVVYYPKDKDGKRVEAALKDLGFQVIQGHGNPELEEKETNAIFFGPRVKLEDLKLVAVALVKGGVTIQVIRPSHIAANADVIQVAHSDHPGTNSPFTPETIENAQTLGNFS